jgi:hypothetical protein
MVSGMGQAPSMRIFWPVMYAAPSDIKNATVPAISSAVPYLVPSRPGGVLCEGANLRVDGGCADV